MYLVVKGYIIYSSINKSRFYRDNLFNDKDAMWYSLSLFENSKKSCEREDIVQRYLENICSENYTNFIVNWEWFDMIGDEARLEIKEILDTYAYICNYEVSIEEPINEHGKFYFNTAFNKKSIALIDQVKRKLNKNETINKDKQIRILIDESRVSRIVGTLKEFIVYTDDYNLIFRDGGFDICPKSISMSDYYRIFDDAKYQVYQAGFFLSYNDLKKIEKDITRRSNFLLMKSMSELSRNIFKGINDIKLNSSHVMNKILVNNLLASIVEGRDGWDKLGNGETFQHFYYDNGNKKINYKIILTTGDESLKEYLIDSLTEIISAEWNLQLITGGYSPRNLFIRKYLRYKFDKEAIDLQLTDN